MTAYGRAAQTQTFVGLHPLGSRSHGFAWWLRDYGIAMSVFIYFQQVYRHGILKPVCYFRLDCAHKLFPVKPELIHF